MTDRFAGFIVVLETNIRDDDAEATMKALRQIKNIADVIPHVANVELSIAESRARINLVNRVQDVLKDIILGK